MWTPLKTLLWVAFWIGVANNEQIDTCQTPDRKIGFCVSIRSCRPLLDLLWTNSTNPAARDFLRRSQCGQDAQGPKVCCPRTQNDQPSGNEGAIAAAAAQFRRPKCGANEFMCVNQQRCIHEFDKCDGNKDCSDGSDETYALCSKFGRSCGSMPFSFKCAYGACIDKSKECDGVDGDCADNSDEAECFKLKETPETTSRCQTWEFTCTSGDCINITDVCDGAANCKDKSDETIAQCARMSCSFFSFQCAYGACIDWDKRCDKNVDCNDGSDEVEELCKKAVDTSENGTINKPEDSNSTNGTCSFPSHEYTKYRLGCRDPSAPKCQPKAGMQIKKNSAVFASCPPGYALPFQFAKKPASAVMICISPPNFNMMITCEKMCAPLVSESHNIECKLNREPVPCDKLMYPGTHVHLECKKHFKAQKEIRAVSETHCQPDGTLTYGLYKCIPECGHITKVREDNKVAFGTTVELGEAPWYAGMWGLKNGTYKHFCGGTIISPNLIITAAHCFAAFIGPTKSDDIANIQVAVAKYVSKWEIKGEHEQRVGVKTIYERRGYVGRPGFEKDIAVVELLQNLVFTNYVIPACVDWKKEGTFWARTQGYIVGFGNTENHKPSETLQAASLSYIPPFECNKRIRASSHGFQQGIMWDQFCAGSDLSVNTTSVQPGDSGGGYTFLRSGKYYLYGVLSHRLSGVDAFAVYTNIPEHTDWLKENLFHESLV